MANAADNVLGVFKLLKTKVFLDGSHYKTVWRILDDDIFIGFT